MAVWNREYQGIGITAEDRIVRILNDDALCERLKENGRAEAYRIALDVKEYYQKLFGGEVSISAKSLACEIYWHYLIKVKSEAIEKKWGKKKLPGPDGHHVAYATAAAPEAGPLRYRKGINHRCCSLRSDAGLRRRS